MLGCCCTPAPRHRRILENALQNSCEDSLNQFSRFVSTQPTYLRLIAKHLEESLTISTLRNRVTNVKRGTQVSCTLIKSSSSHLSQYEYYIIKIIRILFQRDFVIEAGQLLVSFVQHDSSRHARQFTEFFEFLSNIIKNSKRSNALKLFSLFVIIRLGDLLKQSILDYLNSFVPVLIAAITIPINFDSIPTISELDYESLLFSDPLGFDYELQSIFLVLLFKVVRDCGFVGIKTFTDALFQPARPESKTFKDQSFMIDSQKIVDLSKLVIYTNSQELLQAFVSIVSTKTQLPYSDRSIKILIDSISPVLSKIEVSVSVIPQLISFVVDLIDNSTSQNLESIFETIVVNNDLLIDSKEILYQNIAALLSILVSNSSLDQSFIIGSIYSNFVTCLENSIKFDCLFMTLILFHLEISKFLPKISFKSDPSGFVNVCVKFLSNSSEVASSIILKFLSQIFQCFSTSLKLISEPLMNSLFNSIFNSMQTNFSQLFNFCFYLFMKSIISGENFTSKLDSSDEHIQFSQFKLSPFYSIICSFFKYLLTQANSKFSSKNLCFVFFIAFSDGLKSLDFTQFCELSSNFKDEEPISNFIINTPSQGFEPSPPSIIPSTDEVHVEVSIQEHKREDSKIGIKNHAAAGEMAAGSILKQVDHYLDLINRGQALSISSPLNNCNKAFDDTFDIEQVRMALSLM
ncbi:hypothetical protein RCL1_004130 [Eukaryota sp. TZLM3-RCL]